METYYDKNNQIIAATKAALDNAFQTLEGLEAQTVMMTGRKPRYYINGYISDRRGVIDCINNVAPFIKEIKHSAKFNIIIKYED